MVFGPEELHAVEVGDEMIMQQYLVPSEWEQADTPLAHNAFFDERGDLRQDCEYSGQVLLDRHGQPYGMFASRNQLTRGEPRNVQVVEEPAFEHIVHLAASVFAAHGGAGCLNVQARQIAPSAFVVFELNARCTGITGLRASLGFNEIDALYEHFVLGVPRPQMGRAAPDVWAQAELVYRSTRHDDVETLLATGQWHRSS